MIQIVAKRIDKIKRKKEQEKFIEKMKNLVKKEESFRDACREYGVDVDFIDNVNISYDDNLDVSAKTVNGEIFLNGKLFDCGDMCDNVRYTVHESIHCMQQSSGRVNERTSQEDYLDDPNEQEAFQYQVQYMNDHIPQEEVQEYLEHLLDHHDIKGKERTEKIKKLTENL